MAATRGELDRYDGIAINSVVYSVAWEKGEDACIELAPDLLVPRTDQSDEMSENHLDRAWTRSQRFWCVDEATEILTQRGWLSLDEVRCGDWALSLTEDGSRWDEVRNVYVWEAQPRKMLSLETTSHSSLTTEDHRWLVRGRPRDGGKLHWETSASLNGSNRIPISAPRMDIPTEAKWSDALVELVAWFYTEGWFRWYGRKANGKPAGIGIAQSGRVNPQKVQRIRQALNVAFPGEWWENNRRKDQIIVFNINVGPSKLLESLAPKKVPSPEFLVTLTAAQLQLFIDVSMLGDGHTHVDPTWGPSHYFTQFDRDRMSAFEMACALAGYATTVRPVLPGSRFSEREGFCTNVLRRTHVTPIASARRNNKNSSATWITYNQRVWCPQLASGTWLARRRGTVFFTGNSFGAGATRFDGPSPTDQQTGLIEKHGAFASSKGIDITSFGELKVLPATSKILALTNTGQVMCQTDLQTFVAAGQPNLQVFSTLTGSDAAAVSTATETSKECTSLTTDGNLVYAAVGSDGIHRGTRANVAFRAADSASAQNAGTSVTLTITKPAGTVENDVLVATITVSGTSGTTAGTAITPPSGWTSIQVTDVADARTESFYKVAGGAEPANYAFVGTSAAGTTDSSGGIIAVSGADTTSPIHTSAENSGTGTTVTVPSIVTTVAGCLLYAAVGSGGSATATPPSGYTERFDLTGSAGHNSSEASTVLQGLAESTGTLSVTLSGSENWVAHHIAIAPKTNPTYTFAHWSDWDGRVVRFIKDQVFAAGIKTGSQWRFFKAAATTTSTEVYALPDGWSVSDIAPLGPYVYFSAYRNSASVIYAYDGTNAPFIAFTMPTGDQAISLGPFPQGGMLIGSRRLTNTSGAGLGVLYKAYPRSDGTLVVDRVLTIGSDNGTDYGIKAMAQAGDNAYFGYSYADGSSSGLGVFVPTYGAQTRDIHGSVSGSVRAAGVFKGRKIFTIDGDGVYIEQSTYLTSGQLTSSIFDWNIEKNKLLLSAEGGFNSLAAGESVQVEYSVDNGTTWTSAFTESTDGATGGFGAISSVSSAVTARQVQYRLTLTAGTSQATTPIVKKAGFSAIYGVKPVSVWQVWIRAYDHLTLANGTAAPDSGKPHTLSKTIENALKSLRANQTPVSFQLPDWTSSADTKTVTVGDIEVRRRKGKIGNANLIRLTLNEVPLA